MHRSRPASTALNARLADQPRAQTVMQPGARTKSIFHNPKLSMSVDIENPLEVGLPEREDLSPDLVEDEGLEASKDSAPAKSIFDVTQSRSGSKSPSPKALQEAAGSRVGATQSASAFATAKTQSSRPSLLNKPIASDALALRKQSLSTA